MPAHPTEDGRDEEIYLKYVKGRRQSALAAEYGLIQQRIAQIIKEQRALIEAEDRAELIRDSLELQRHIKSEALKIADMLGAPMAVGKEGTILYDPDTGAVVRDYAARMKALALAAQADDTIAKRLGLDAATKTESTDTVRYVLDGVNLDDLK